MSATVARPTRIRLRQWQSEALGKLAAATSPDFLAVATPGAGKTTFALAAALAHLEDEPGARVIVVAPTQHLKSQWALAAARLGLHLDPAWSSREGALPSDMHGVVTTYQQVSTSADALARLAGDAFVVLDEVHHAGDDRSWGAALLVAFGGAARRLSLSGTPFRSDSSAIPFVEYHLEEARPDIEYGYGDALVDGGVVRPVYFPRVGGFMEWVAPDGAQLAATFDDELGRQRANERLRTALSLEGGWLRTVLDQADERLGALRREHPAAGGLVIATDQDHARGIAALLERRCGPDDVVLATSDDPSASARIAAFAGGTQRWIVAVRMVSEGVDIPRLRVAVFATTTTTELFFRQAVGRVVRHTPGLRRQKSFVFLPDDLRLVGHATRIAESRRHSLRQRAERDAGAGDPLRAALGDDEEQLSMFAVIGSVALDASGTGGVDGVDGVFGEDPDDPGGLAAGDGLGPGVEVMFLTPPPPGGRAAPRGQAGDDPGGDGDDVGGEGLAEVLTLRRRKQVLRDANAEVVLELVRSSGWGHAQVNRELNRLSGITRVGEATLAQLEVRLEAARAWLRRS